MPKTGKERQADLRARQSRYVTATFSKVLKLEKDIAELRDIVLSLRDVSISPLSKEVSKKEESKEVRKRESEQARLSRLSLWTPNGDHEQRAFEMGFDLAWVTKQEEWYRAQQVNAKIKHKDFDAGFTAWLIRAPTFEGNGNGHAKQSPVEKLYEGAARAVAAREARRRAGLSVVEPLLDSRRSAGGPASSD